VSGARILRVRCTTWDQVEGFYTSKLRRGRLLTMRVPFEPALNEALTVGLELPSQLVIAIDGTVTHIGAAGTGGKHAVEVNLHGLTAELLDRVRALVAEARASGFADTAPAPGRARTDEVSIDIPVERSADRSGERPVERVSERAAERSGDRPIEPGGFGPSDVQLLTPLPGPDVIVTMPLVGLASAAPTVPAVETTPPESLEEETDLGLAARVVFEELDAALRRLRELPAHEVLGVPWDADPRQVRAAWIALGRRYHPDVMVRHRARALRHLSEELTIHVNRAYDRMRAALVAEGRAAAFGPALHPPRGWLVGFEDLGTVDPLRVPPPELSHDPPRPRGSTVRFESAPLRAEDLFGDLPIAGSDGASALSLPTGRGVPGDAFEKQARARLAVGDHAAAREILAAALHVYPRSQPLRALYHVASAMDALDGGQSMLATSQLEAALVQDPECREAAAALDALRGRNPDGGLLRRLFR
jgi:hypothetical protein